MVVQNVSHIRTQLGLGKKVWAFQVALVVKNQPANAGDLRDKGSLPSIGKTP